MSFFAGWLLNAAYATAIIAASPWILWAAIRQGKYREGFVAKVLGRAPKRSGDVPCVWLHAVSVGEVNLLATTIAELSARQPGCEIVVSTTTKTGYDLAVKKYADRTVFYAPLDFSWATAAAMRRVRPSLLVLAELELWPNLIAAAKRHGARVAIINGRLSDKSFRNYRRIRPLVGPVLRQIDLIAAQNAETAERFRALGASPGAVHATGSLKFDGAQTDRANPRTGELRRLAGLDDRHIVLLAGSTQDPEEQYALTIFERLSAEYPNLRLIIVPRHQHRFDEVAAMLDRSGVPWQLRTQLQPRALPGGSPAEGIAQRNPRAEPGAESASAEPGSESLPRSNSRDLTDRRWHVLLVDAIGELGAWWGTAAVGFVGGSFGARGGQNMLEPAAYGVATCFGPNTWNFRDIVAQLLAAEGAAVVQDADQFEAFVRRALAEPEFALTLGSNARRLVQSQQGATRRTIDRLLPLMTHHAPRPLLHRAA